MLLMHFKKIDRGQNVDKRNNLQQSHKGVKAQYSDHRLSEYNNNLLIEALPPILDIDEFTKKVAINPEFSEEEILFDSKYRFHCIHRLSYYFDPQIKTIELQKIICVLLMQGYLDRNPKKPEYANRANQIYQAIKNSGGKHLEDYVTKPSVAKPTSASGVTLIGPSGMGKTTNLLRILDLYPQVIFHPQLNCHQIVWLKVNCPHAGSLKGLCSDIFKAIDLLLETDYDRKFTSRNNNEDTMLGQVVQVAHTHHLGLLVIDELQNLVNAKRNKDDLLNFLVKMDNDIGIPVIRVGTDEATKIIQANFRNARRATGEGSIIWERMLQTDNEWAWFIEGLWEYQWTKTYVKLTDEIKDLFYYETQGIIDIAIKLFKMVQWRTIAGAGNEEITIEIIKEVAKDGLHFVRAMLNAIRSGNREWMLEFKDISPVDTSEYEKRIENQLDANALEELRKSSRAAKHKNDSPQKRHIILELLKLDIEPSRAKECAEQAISKSGDDADIKQLVTQAYTFALEGEISTKKPKTSPKSDAKKISPKYQSGDIRLLLANSTENKTSGYAEFQKLGYVGNMLQDFFAET
jgi:AAA domain